ncbi:MAG: Gfo/Idh/MocA family oxidoreductase [Opitutales bacterium]|nr:Gfo/Idh/MocA family oxidoreductase [Opitutales bacterium]
MLKIGLIGLGPIGSLHIDNLTGGKVDGAELACVCDMRKVDNPKIANIPFYSDTDKMLSESGVDAVVVATPSFTHFDLAKKCLLAGKHVLVEKPISLCSADAKKLQELAKKQNKICAVMLNQRTTPIYRRIKEMVSSGEIGKVNRVSWNMTNWFRPQIYFDMSVWRGLWKGEAGGVLINQAIHNIDAFAWIFGLPQSLRAWCKFGKYHNIEVEDEVSCYMEYPEDMTATFITSSGEHPGSNRFEISGDKAYVIAEDGKLRISKFKDGSARDFTLNTKYAFGTPETVETVEEFDGKGGQHAEVMNNFAGACMGKNACSYGAEQGVLSLTLANSMLYSSFTNAEIKFPFDDEAYAQILAQKQAASELRKEVRKDFILDFNKSFR